MLNQISDNGATGKQVPAVQWRQGAGPLTLFLALVFIAVAFVQSKFEAGLVLGLVQATFVISLLLLFWFPGNAVKGLRRALHAVSIKPVKGFGAFSTSILLLASVLVLFLFPVLRADFSAGLASSWLGFDSLVFWVIAPLVEETFFRGFVLNSLHGAEFQNSKNNALANHMMPLYISSLVFFVFHWPVDLNVWAEAWKVGAVPLNFGPFFLGIWAGIIFIRDGSLFWCVLAHSIANFFAPLWGLVLMNFAV